MWARASSYIPRDGLVLRNPLGRVVGYDEAPGSRVFGLPHYRRCLITAGKKFSSPLFLNHLQPKSNVAILILCRVMLASNRARMASHRFLPLEARTLMTPRQARRERREAERKAKKLELKKARQTEKHPLAAVDEFPEVQPRWNPELEDEFPREVRIRNNAMADRIARQAGLPIPPPGPTSGPFSSLEEMRAHYLAKRNAANTGEGDIHPALAAGRTASETGFVSQKRVETNRANAKLSTGPRSITGKLASSRNSTASGQLIIPGEDPEAFESLLSDLLQDLNPPTRPKSCW